MSREYSRTKHTTKIPGVELAALVVPGIGATAAFIMPSKSIDRAGTVTWIALSIYNDSVYGYSGDPHDSIGASYHCHVWPTGQEKVRSAHFPTLVAMAVLYGAISRQ